MYAAPSLPAEAGTSRRAVAWRAVSILLGILLLGAAALKLWDNAPPTSPSTPLFESPVWRTALIEAEMILGLLLLSGWAQRATWFASLVFFVGLAGISLYLALRGEPSCGCFGKKLPISPWYMLALDLAALASLVWWRPHGILRKGEGQNPIVSEAFPTGTASTSAGAEPSLPSAELSDFSQFLRWLRVPLAFAAFLGVGLTVFGVAKYGSLSAFRAYLQGHSLVADSMTKTVGKIPERAATQVTLNYPTYSPGLSASLVQGQVVGALWWRACP